jgi:hypothetical protein
MPNRDVTPSLLGGEQLAEPVLLGRRPPGAENSLGDLLGARKRVVHEPASRVGEDDERKPCVTRVGLASDESDALQRSKLPGDSGWRDAEVVGEIEPPESLLRGGAQLEEQSEVAQAEPVERAEIAVQLPDDLRTSPREPENDCKCC